MLKFNEIWKYLSSSQPTSFTLATPWSIPSSDQPFIRRWLVFHDFDVSGFRFSCYETTVKSLDRLIYKSHRQSGHDLVPVLMESYTLGYTELDLTGIGSIYQTRGYNPSHKMLLNCYRQRLTLIQSVANVVPKFVATFIADTQEELARALHLEKSNTVR